MSNIVSIDNTTCKTILRFYNFCIVSRFIHLSVSCASFNCCPLFSSFFTKPGSQTPKLLSKLEPKVNANFGKNIPRGSDEGKPRKMVIKIKFCLEIQKKNETDWWLDMSCLPLQQVTLPLMLGSCLMGKKKETRTRSLVDQVSFIERVVLLGSIRKAWLGCTKSYVELSRDKFPSVCFNLTFCSSDNIIKRVFNIIKFTWVLFQTTVNSFTKWMNSMCREYIDISTVLRIERCMLTREVKKVQARCADFEEAVAYVWLRFIGK